MRLLISFIFTLLCLCPAKSQETEAKEVLFKVFVKDNDGTRIDLTANENFTTSTNNTITQIKRFRNGGELLIFHRHQHLL